MLKKQFQLRSMTPAALLTMTLASVPASVLACGLDAYLGQTCIIAGAYCPEGTLPAEGQLLPITNYQALYSLLYTTYGGDGRTNFALPDLQGRVPVAWGRGAGLTNHNPGDKFGAETTIQIQAQMPVHNHLATLSGGGGSAVSVAIGTSAGNVAVPTVGQTVYLTGLSGNFNGDPVDMNGPYTTTTPSSMATLGGISGGGAGGTVTLGYTGGSQAMPNVPPEIAIRYCIVATNGYYPPRP